MIGQITSDKDRLSKQVDMHTLKLNRLLQQIETLKEKLPIMVADFAVELEKLNSINQLMHFKLIQSKLLQHTGSTIYQIKYQYTKYVTLNFNLSI